MRWLIGGGWPEPVSVLLSSAFFGLFARPPIRRAFLVVVIALALIGCLAVYTSHERASAAAEAVRDLEAQQSQEVLDAIQRAAPGPRPSNSEFLDCLRRAGPGCL
ncbi:MAG: hypothetical protein EpisKO_05720 [Epibacterium sp.]